MPGQNHASSAAIDDDDGLLLALDGGKIGTWRYTTASRIFKFSARSAQLLGLPQACVELRDLLLLVHPDDRPEVASTFEKIEAGWTCDIDVRIQDRQRSALWVRIRGASLADPGGARG